MRTYVLPAEKIIGELRRISPYDECNYDWEDFIRNSLDLSGLLSN
jgi:hypothetical protein